MAPGAVAHLPIADEGPPSPGEAAARIGEIEGGEPTGRFIVERLVGVEREDPVVGGQFDGAALLEPEAEKRLVLDPRAKVPRDRDRGVGRAGVEDEALGASPGAFERGGEPLARVRVAPDFKLSPRSAQAWVDGGYAKPR